MKKLVSVICIMVILTLSVGVTALSDNGITFDGQPFTSASIVCFDKNIDNVWSGTINNPNNHTLYAVECYGPNAAINGIHTTYIFSNITSNLNSDITYTINYDGNISSRTFSQTQSYEINGETWYYSFREGGADVNMTTYGHIPYYEENWSQSFLSNLIGEIQNTNGGDNNNSNLNYSLPPGNLAIIQTTASYESIKLSTTMPLQSSLFSGNPWPNTTQRIGTYNTLPTSLNATTLGSVIDWQRTGDANLFGQTHSAEYQPSVTSKFSYIVISNPYYYPANNMDDNQYTNGAISISMDDVVNIEIRNLTASINPTTGEVENIENGTTWTGEIDSETGDITWTDNDGGNTNPNGGGNLSDATITGFQSWLKGILTSIRDIFEPAHDAIQTLSSSVRNFANWMYALYIWLPSPILNLLTSAISLAIVIGVIKVFI